MRASATRHQTVDPTIYPEEERVGEDMLQRWIMELLRPLLQRWLTSRGVKAFVGADQFIYWRKHDPHARVAPYHGPEVSFATEHIGLGSVVLGLWLPFPLLTGLSIFSETAPRYGP